MDTKLIDGGFALGPRNRPFLVGGADEVAQQIRIRLALPRGAFTPMPELGSRLRDIPRGSREEMSRWARYAVEEALMGMAGVTLTDIVCDYRPEEDRAHLTLSVAPLPGWDFPTLAEACRERVAGYAAGLRVGQALYLSRIIGTVLEIPGVVNCKVISPAGDQHPLEDRVITLGSVAVQRMEVV